MIPIPTEFDVNRKNYYTGYYGAFSTRTRNFAFGIQEATKTEVEQKFVDKTGDLIRHSHFIVKRITGKHYRNFRDGLKWREEFESYMKENEEFKRRQKNERD